MTPAELELAARERYNAVGETFWSSIEIYRLIYAACLEIATETKCIERTYTASTVAGTSDYAVPANTISVKRVTYEGKKLEPVDMRQADALSLNNSTTTVQGTPVYYTEWNDTLTLIPTPDAVGTLVIYSVNEPQALSASTATLEVPTFCHMRILNYILAAMYAKDSNFSSSKYYHDIWTEKDIPAIRQWWKKKKRGDSFANVLNEESLPNTILGLV